MTVKHSILCSHNSICFICILLISVNQSPVPSCFKSFCAHIDSLTHCIILSYSNAVSVTRKYDLFYLHKHFSFHPNPGSVCCCFQPELTLCDNAKQSFLLSCRGLFLCTGTSFSMWKVTILFWVCDVCFSY